MHPDRRENDPTSILNDPSQYPKHWGEEVLDVSTSAVGTAPLRNLWNASDCLGEYNEETQRRGRGQQEKRITLQTIPTFGNVMINGCVQLAQK
jgi:hypothetical protein